jgi:hypothetical protein
MWEMDMLNRVKKQSVVQRAALMAIGRALRHQFECEQPENLPDHIREMLVRLENEEKSKNKYY